MKMVLLSAVVFLGASAQAAPQPVVQAAETAIYQRCDTQQKRVSLTSESVREIVVDQGQVDELYTLGFSVPNNGNDNDDDLVEVQVLDAKVSNPTAGVKPVVVGLKVYGWTVCR